MNRGYNAFVSLIAILWVVMVSMDLLFVILLYRPNFFNFLTIQFPFFVIIPLPVLITYVPGTFTVVWLAFVIIALVAFFGFMLYKGTLKFENSSLYRISEFFALNYFLSVVYFYVISYAGYPVITPITNSIPFFENLFSLTNAGLYEELISRVTYIGIPLFLYYSYSMNGMRSSSKPNKLPWYRIVWGGGYRFGKPEIIVLIISSLIFGFAHASSWNMSKVPQAALGGFLLGALYLRFGIYADVLFHFSVDSSSVLFPQQFGNPYATTFTTNLFNMIVLAFVIAGAVVLISYVIQAVNLYRKRGKISAVPEVVTSPALNTCPKCGSRDFVYFYDDFYRCNSCGNVFKKDQ